MEIEPVNAPDLDGMTKAELLEYAAEQGVDANSAMNKADIKAAIQAAE